MTQCSKRVPAVRVVRPPMENTRELYDKKIVASDGDIGHIRDFYFDDNTWAIRYAVAYTGSWLPGDLVLLSPKDFGRLDQHEELLHIDLRKVQIPNNLSIESHQPLFRRYETGYSRDNDVPAYWDVLGWGYWRSRQSQGPFMEQDKHLRSTLVVTGYRIQATDGIAGHVTGFLVDGESWVIRYLVVEAGHWYSSKEVWIPTHKIDRISYPESKVYVNLAKADIQPRSSLKES